VFATPAFTPRACADLLALARSLDRWTPAPVRSGERVAVDGAHRLAERMSFATCEEACAAGLGPWVEPLTEIARDIDRRHLRTGFQRVEQVQIVRYETSGHYRWHIDGHDPRDRKVSTICYLDDAATAGLEGGETEFAPTPLGLRTGLRTADELLSRLAERSGSVMRESPVCGRALTFPSWIRHRAAPVRHGRKHVLLLMFV
jgi:hypothetical protein